YGDGIGKTIFKFIGTGGISTEFTRSTSVVANYSINNITFDGNRLATHLNIYRHIDLDLYKISVINHIGKGLVIDRSYQVTVKNSKFLCHTDDTPESLVYLATNAVTIDSQCYF